MPRDAAFHLPRGVLRKLMQQVGLSPSAAMSTGGKQLLRRINNLGSDASGDDEADHVASDSDGYDTVCDCDDDGDDSASDAASVHQSSNNNRNNNGTLSGRPSDTEPLETSDLNGAGTGGISNLQSHMDSVIMSAIESLRSAYDSLLELENTRQTERLCNLQVTNNNDVVGIEDDLGTEDSQSTASEQRLTVATSLMNDSTNCRGKVIASHDTAVTSSTLACVGEEGPMPPSRSSPPRCRTIDRSADQLVRVADSDNRPATHEIAKRLLRHRNREARRKQQVGAAPQGAKRLAERLDNLELLLLALQQPLAQQHQKGQIGKGKLDALAALKRNLGCLQAHLLLLQARELSKSAGDQHKRLDRTWNFRRDWKPVEPKRGRVTANMLEPAPGLSRRPARRDWWLLKFLPADQRRALPQLMRSVGFHQLAPMPGSAAAAAVPVTRARGRPVVASHMMRDPRNDVMQRFLHALKP